MKAAFDGGLCAFDPEESIEAGAGLKFKVVEDALVKPLRLDWFAAPEEMDGLGWGAGWGAGWGNLVVNGLVAAVDSIAEALALIPEKEGREGPAVAVAVFDARAEDPERENS